MSDDRDVGAGLSATARHSIERLYRAFSEGGDLLDEAVTADWQDIPLAPGQGPGREAMKPMIEGFRAAFPDAVVTIHDMFGVGGRAAVRGEITGTHRGEWFGVPATGKSFRIAIHEFHQLENDRLTHTWHLEDWFGWMAQVDPAKEA